MKRRCFKIDSARRRVLTRCLIAIVGLLIADTSLSPASAASRTEKTFGSWVVVCTEADNQPKRCSMIQRRIRADTKKLIMVWSISSDKDNQLIQSLVVPAGVSIKEGVRVFLGDAEPITIAY